jgi:hypothetical protein
MFLAANAYYVSRGERSVNIFLTANAAYNFIHFSRRTLREIFVAVAA